MRWSASPALRSEFQAFDYCVFLNKELIDSPFIHVLARPSIHSIGDGRNEASAKQSGKSRQV
jgi:hypothetical protein